MRFMHVLCVLFCLLQTGRRHFPHAKCCSSMLCPVSTTPKREEKTNFDFWFSLMCRVVLFVVPPLSSVLRVGYVRATTTFGNVHFVGPMHCVLNLVAITGTCDPFCYIPPNK